MNKTKGVGSVNKEVATIKERADVYIGKARFASICGIPRANIAKVAVAARIRIKQVPGMLTRYHLGDVEALAARSVRVAGTSESTIGADATSPQTTTV